MKITALTENTPYNGNITAEQYEFMKKYMPQLSYLSCGESILL